jgi:hypothetical protein
LVFVDQWLLGDLPNLLFWTVPLLAAALYANPARRRVYELVLVVAVLAVAVSYVAAVYPVTLALQAQFWRALWLAKLMALFAAVDIGILLVARRNRPYWRLLLACILGLALISLTDPIIAIVLLCVPKLLVRAGLDWRRSALCKKQHLVAYALPVLTLLIVPHLYFAFHSIGAAQAPVRALPDWALGILSTSGLGIGAVAVWLALHKLSARYAFAFVGLWFCAAALSWDARGGAQVARELVYNLPRHVSGVSHPISPGSVVYWHRDPERAWFALGVSGYASTTHATGLIFSRTRTLLLADRLRRVVVATSNPERDIDESELSAEFDRLSARLPNLRLNVLAAYEEESGTALSTLGVRILCRDKALDFVIDSHRWNDLAPEKLPAVYGSGSGRDYYVYQCKKLNQQPPVA